MRFSDITGQQKLKKNLIRTVREQRVSHAQLFFGPEGNEKLALAIAYAQYINCRNPLSRGGDGGDSCGNCPSCIKYQKLIHPDLHFLYPVATTKKVPKKPRSIDFIEDWRKFLLGTNYYGTIHEWYECIGIENKQGIINADDCTEINSILGYKSYESEYKVMILWMVEKLYYAAAPKILKILEEPPEKTLFLLISEDPDQVLNTIRSRALPVKVPKPEVERKLTDNSLNFTTFREWMRWCVSSNMPELINFSATITKTGRERQKEFLEYALVVVQQCSSMNFLEEPVIAEEGEEREFISRIAPFINHSNLVEFTDLFNTAIHHIERNSYGPVLFLDVSFQVMRLLNSVPKKKNR